MGKTMKMVSVAEELERIRLDHGGLLRPGAVVTEAATKESPLHSHFEWDDRKASHQWRLRQAQELIRVTVIVHPQNDQQYIRAYVSLRQDRKANGGYRSMVEVMSDKELWQMAIEEMLQDITTLQHKYRTMKEFAPIAESIDNVRTRLQLPA